MTIDPTNPGGRQRHTRGNVPDLPTAVNALAIREGAITLFDEVERDGGHVEDAMMRIEGVAATAIATMIANTPREERAETCQQVAQRMVLNITKLAVIVILRLDREHAREAADDRL
jgi:hypothetical protein